MSYKRISRPKEQIEYHDPMYKRLQELEDKIENGTLIELPCKVGDKVYILGSKVDSDKVEIFEDIVWEILIRQFNHLKVGVVQVHKFGTGRLQLADFNKEWFLTKAEAEAKLKELKGE